MDSFVSEDLRCMLHPSHSRDAAPAHEELRPVLGRMLTGVEFVESRRIVVSTALGTNPRANQWLTLPSGTYIT